MRNEHVSGSPYLITIDKEVEYVTGHLSYELSAVKNVSRIRPKGRSPNVLLRIVDFVTEKMLLTEDGKLTKLPPETMVTASRIPREVAVSSSFDGINNNSDPYSTAERNGDSMESGTISNIDRNKRAGSSLRMSPLTYDTNLAPPQRHALKRQDLDFFGDRCKKVMLLCRLFVKRNPSHNSFQILHSAEQFLDGRPVRFTDKTFKLIESALKSIQPETDEDSTDECTETNICDTDVFKFERNTGSAGVIYECKQMPMTCECITSCPLKTIENGSHTPTEMMNVSKLMSVEPNLLRVQHREMIRDMRPNTEITVGDNSGCDLNCTGSSEHCYDADHSPKHQVYDVNDLNEGTEVNDTKAKNNISLSSGAQHPKIWNKGLTLGTPSTDLTPSTRQYANLRLETRSIVKFPDKQTQKEYAVLIRETADIKVTNQKLQVDQVGGFIFMPRYLRASQQNIMKSVPERNCIKENENRINEIDCVCSDVHTLIEREVPFASGCKQRATFISAKNGIDVISHLPSPLHPEHDSYQRNKTEKNVHLNPVLRTETSNEGVHYQICHATGFSSTIGIDYKNTEYKICASVGRNFESTEICSRRNKHLQSANHPAQVVSICEHSELQLEDEASDKIYRDGKNDTRTSSTEITRSSKNDSIKVIEIFINEGTPSHEEKNHTNTQAKQTIGTVLVDLSSNTNISVMGTGNEDRVYRRHIGQNPAEDLENDDLINITYYSRRVNNMNICTLLPQTLQEPPEDGALQLDSAYEQRCATSIGPLSGDMFDSTTRVETAAARYPSSNDSCDTSNIFPDLEDILSQNSIAYMASSSNYHQEHPFHLWSSEGPFESSPGVTFGLYDDKATDFESVLAAPNLEEPLRKLDQMLRVIKERDTSDNVYKFCDVSVSTGEKAASPSPESCSTNGSTVAENKVHFFIEGYGELMRGSPVRENLSDNMDHSDYISQDYLQRSFGQSMEHSAKNGHRSNFNESRKNNESRNISAPTSSKNYRKQNIFKFSAQEKRRKQLSENGNAAVTGFNGPADKDIWDITQDEIKYDIGSYDNGAPLSADLTSNLLQIRHCSRILPERAPIMRSREEENDLSDRYTSLHAHLQDNSESSGKFTVMSLSLPRTTPEEENEEQQDEAANIKDFAKECNPPNFTDIETLKHVVISNGIAFHSKSNGCASNKIEYSEKITQEIMSSPTTAEDMATQRAAPIFEGSGHFDNIKNSPICRVERRTRERYLTRHHQSDSFYHNKYEIETRRESLAKNTEYSSSNAGYIPPDIVTQPIAGPGENILQKNKTNVRHSFQSLDYIPEVSKFIHLESPIVGVNSSTYNNTKIPESHTESEQNPLAVFVNTVDVRRVSNPNSQSQMTGNNVTDKSSLLTLGHENTLHVPAQPSERMKGTNNNVNASTVSNMLHNTENSDVKFHGESENVNRNRRIIIDRQITHDIAKNINSRRLQMFSETDSSVSSLTSNENHAVNEQKYLAETEKSYMELGGLTNQKIVKLCNNVSCGAPCHVSRRISPSVLSNTNTDFRGSYELFKNNQTVNTQKAVLTSQKRTQTPVGKPETTLSLTKYSVHQCEQFMPSCTSNENEMSSLEEWTITARHPVTHSSHMDRVAHSMPQMAGDTSRAISLPQPSVITTDMDILHPLVTKETDPEGSIGETRHDNKLSNKIDEIFESTVKK
jgi:hypothetical protein